MSLNRHILPMEDPVNHPDSVMDVRDQERPPQAIPRVRPPDGAPNVLVVLIDDMGFGASSAFGGPCRMPTAQRLAGDGLRFSRFHTTGVCAPTRISLLTGRNHHSCGMGAIPELATSAPGYTGVRPRSTATIARMLSCNGYATGAFGKMHQTPPWELTPAGPFDRWPTGDGFDRFYGFIGAETDQFHPNLIDGVTPIVPHQRPDREYHLSEDLVDQAIGWVESVNGLDPHKPWFCYLSFGACHAPLHVPEQWRDRYRGEFAHGWDEQRERTLARQKELGVVPAEAELAPWSEGVPRWKELTDAQRRVAERLMEMYAAFAEHTDAQTGRLIDALQRKKQLDNTLVLYILGDNGSAAEVGLDGTLNEYTAVNGLPDTAERMLHHLDEIGGPHTYPAYPPGWALGMDAPYQWVKSVASHYGGTRNGLIVRWADGIASRDEVRHQWHHCIDVVPTILEVAGLPEPTVVDGVRQQPVEGVSFAYAFDDADAPDRHTRQYFEIFGNRGIYDRGWTAVTKHRAPWELFDTAPALAEDVWELYDTSADWTQARDVALKHPEKLAELKQLFLIEAAKYQVLPLDDRVIERLDPEISRRPDLMAGRRAIVLLPSMPGLHELAAPNFKNTSFTLTALIEVPLQGAEGVLVAQGGRFGGWSLYVKDGVPCYCHNLAGVERMYMRADRPLSPGRRTVEFRFVYDGGGLGKAGTATMLIDGQLAGAGRIDRTTGHYFSHTETLDVGIDRLTPVTEEYPSAPGNAFNGTIDSVHIDLGIDALEPSAADKARAARIIH